MSLPISSRLHNPLVVPVLVQLVAVLLLVVPNTASVLTNHFRLLLENEAFKIGQDGVEREVVLENVEASLVGDHGHDRVTDFLRHIVVVSVDATI